MSKSRIPCGNVTFLFTNMEGSTKLARKLGDVNFQRLIQNPYQAIWAEVVNECNGYLVQFTGDGYLATFEDPNLALQAAIKVQSRLKTDPISAEKDGTVHRCIVRIGLHRSEFDLIPNSSGGYDDAYSQLAYARRVMESSCDAQILVSQTLWKAAGGDIGGRFKWFPWDNRYLKSFTEAPDTLYELLWDGASKGEPGTRWTPVWYSCELNSYIDRPEPMKFIRDWMEASTAGKSATLGSIRKSPLLTIHGFGGMGKTRLAVETVLQTCALFPAGTAFIRLDEITSALKPEQITGDMLTRAVATELECEPEVFKTAKDLISLLRERVKKGAILLVLDNWESVKNTETMQWLEEILVVGEVFCLLTSRDLAGINNVGKTYEIPFMQTPDRLEEPFETYESGRLFIDRARQLQDDWEVTPSNRPRLFHILKDLVGHPLGIELVAAHVYDNPTLDEIQTGLKASLLKEQQTREGETRWYHPRHSSLVACLNWSLEMLPATEQTAFSRLGVIPFDFSAECAKSVCEIDSEWLKNWRRHSLVLIVRDRNIIRYDMLPIVREYCLDRLKPEVEIYQARYEEWCIEQAGKWDEKNLDKFVSFSNDFRHLIAAADRSLLVPPTLDSANRLNTIGVALGTVTIGDRDANLRSAIRCFDAALKYTTESAFPQYWATTQNNLGNVYQSLPSGDRDANFRSAIRSYEAALRVRTEQAYPQDWAATKNNLGNVYQSLPSGDRDANLRSAIKCYGAALQVYTEQSFPQFWATTQNNLGNAYSALPSGDRNANLRSAIKCYEAALRVYTKQSFLQSWTATQKNLGIVYTAQGRWAEAIECFEKSLIAHYDYDGPSNVGIIFENLALSQSERGNTSNALELERQAIKFFEGAENKSAVEKARKLIAKWDGGTAEAEAILQVARKLIDSGAWQRGLDEARLALEKFRIADDKRGKASAFLIMGEAHLKFGDYEISLMNFKDAERHYRQIGDMRGKAYAQLKIGNVEVLLGANIKAGINLQSARNYFQQHSEEELTQISERLLEFISKSKVTTL